MEKVTLLYVLDPEKGIKMTFTGPWNRTVYDKMLRDTRKGVQTYKAGLRRDHERRQAESKSE